MKLSAGPVTAVNIRVEIDKAGDAIVWANDCELLAITSTGRIILAGLNGEQLEQMGFAVSERGRVVVE